MFDPPVSPRTVLTPQCPLAPSVALLAVHPNTRLGVVQQLHKCQCTYIHTHTRGPPSVPPPTSPAPSSAMLNFLKGMAMGTADLASSSHRWSLSTSPVHKSAHGEKYCHVTSDSHINTSDKLSPCHCAVTPPVSMLSRSCSVWGVELSAENSSTNCRSELGGIEEDRTACDHLAGSTAHRHGQASRGILRDTLLLSGDPYLPGSTRKCPNTKDGCRCTVTEKESFR